MKKLILIFILFLNICYANEQIFLYENYVKGQLLENTNLKDFEKDQESLSNFGLNNGELYVKEFNENKDVFLHFEDKKLNLVIEIIKNEDFTEKDFLIEEKNFNFIAGQINQDSTIKLKEEFAEYAKDELENFYINQETLFRTKSLYFNENNKKEINKMTFCKKVNKHKDCPKCEYISGSDNTINCLIVNSFKIK